MQNTQEKSDFAGENTMKKCQLWIILSLGVVEKPRPPTRTVYSPHAYRHFVENVTARLHALKYKENNSVFFKNPTTSVEILELYNKAVEKYVETVGKWCEERFSELAVGSFF